MKFGQSGTWTYPLPRQESPQPATATVAAHPAAVRGAAGQAREAKVRTEIDSALRTMRQRMDAFIIGQDGIKEATLLALIAREHVYLQGEPGCAKTLLAEVAGHTANLRFHFSQLHRDTRLTELVG